MGLVFVAAPFSCRKSAEMVGARLREIKCCHHVISRWHQVPEELQRLHPRAAQIANLQDLKAARALVALTRVGEGREMFLEVGRFLERNPLEMVIWCPLDGDFSEASGSLTLAYEPGIRRAKDIDAACELIDMWP